VKRLERMFQYIYICTLTYIYRNICFLESSGIPSRFWGVLNFIAKSTITVWNHVIIPGILKVQTDRHIPILVPRNEGARWICQTVPEVSPSTKKIGSTDTELFSEYGPQRNDLPKLLGEHWQGRQSGLERSGKKIWQRTTIRLSTRLLAGSPWFLQVTLSPEFMKAMLKGLPHIR
jgi:hypothetical protein